ncbi:proteoglycan 3-like [Aquarana catesbeiana]|uniref:proteoglycan 3-like n=1 Tax=Aquarana catesbeiana TaxID=8400 RepID=UPI003CCA207F
MRYLLLLLLLGTAYAQEPGGVENDADELVDPSSQEDENDMPDDLEETDLNDCQFEACHNISLEGRSEATCHYRLYTRARKFRKALRFCRRHRGNLCSIHNACVNNQMRALARCRNQSLVWIGLWKPCRRGYCNVDGSCVNWANFGCRQRKGKGKWCVALNVATGQWVSLKCRTRLPFICRT